MPPNYAPDSNRLVTVLVYLSDVKDGGETHFQYADSDEAVPHNVINGKSDGTPPCSADALRSGVTFKPKKGDALIFYNMKHLGQRPDSSGVEPRAVHAGCPVRAGTKLVVSRAAAGQRSKILT